MIRLLFLTLLFLPLLASGQGLNQPIAEPNDHIDITVNLKTPTGLMLNDVLVKLVGNGKEQAATSGSDGIVKFFSQAKGSYTIQAKLSGYNFETKNLNLTSNTTVEINGTQAALTFSGTVKNNQGSPIPSAILTLNGNQVTISQNGTFSTPIISSREYVVHIRDENHLFINQTFKFYSNGSRVDTFIGYTD